MSKIYTALEKLYGKRLFEGTLNADIIPTSIRDNAGEYADILAGKEPGDSAPVIENEDLPGGENSVAGDDDENPEGDNGLLGDDVSEESGNDFPENENDIGENDNVEQGDNEPEAVPEDDGQSESEPNTVEVEADDNQPVGEEPEPAGE